MHPRFLLRCAGVSVVGRRSNNQDALLLRPELGLFAVADGMGGYEGGEVASAAVVRAIEDFVARIAADPEGTWPVRPRRAVGPMGALLDAAVRAADRDVKALRTGRLSRMGSTATAVLLAGDRLAIGHVGDSRVYRLRGALEQLTDDHSVAAELVRSGAQDVVAEQFANCLTRAIGMPDPFAVDVRVEPLCAGDRLLLCSDGLWGALSRDSLATLLAIEAPAEAAQCLIDAAYAGGSTDNISAVVVEIQSPGSNP